MTFASEKIFATICKYAGGPNSKSSAKHTMQRFLRRCVRSRNETTPQSVETTLTLQMARVHDKNLLRTGSCERVDGCPLRIPEQTTRGWWHARAMPYQIIPHNGNTSLATKDAPSQSKERTSSQLAFCRVPEQGLCFGGAIQLEQFPLVPFL